MTTLITEHRKTNHGWAPLRSAPANHALWTPTDRLWIDQLLETGDDTLTVGDTMYQAQWVKDNAA